jgi:hypothetical protein
MSRLHLPIQDPCHENWDAMNREGDARRFCEVCTKQVHDLSAMTERKARKVLEDASGRGRVCVRYTADDAGNINFVPDMAPAPNMWRMTLAAASMTLALLTGCTDSAPDEILEDRCVYEIGPWGFTATRGQGSCPAVDAPEEHEIEMVGMIAIEPQEPPPEPVPTRELKGDIGEPPPPPVVEPEPAPEPKHVKMGKMAVEPQGEVMGGLSL